MTRYIVSRMNSEGYFAKTVTITLRDSFFNTIQRQKSLDDYSNDFDEIMSYVQELVEEYFDDQKAYRLLGVSVSGLVEKENLPKEYNIFNVNDVMKKEIIIDEMIHNFQKKYGENALYRKKKNKD